MVTPDVNILVHAFRPDAEDHVLCSRWLTDRINGQSNFAIVPNVLSGFLRIVTHPRIFERPSRRAEAIAFCKSLVECDLSQWLVPGVRHWEIFTSLCEQADARGNLIPDAWFAALAIEHGCDWISLDRDYARFPGLRWRVPE